MSALGKRYIMTSSSIAGLPDVEPEGTKCFVYEDKNTYTFKNGGWVVDGGGGAITPADIFAIVTYDTSKAVAVLNIPEVYTPILSLVTPSRPAGKYELGLALKYTFLSANRSAFLQWRIDGGLWNEIRSVPSDVTDENGFYYAYPEDYLEAVHTIDVQMRKEDAQSNQLDVQYCDLTFQRVGL
jgi:hypothetical protein